MDWIFYESHFNFIKMHLISHFGDQICQFGNILMYSTVFCELEHKPQIKAGWRQLNKNDAYGKLCRAIVDNMASE